MYKGYRVIDADSHYHRIPDLRDDYIDPEFRDRLPETRPDGVTMVDNRGMSTVQWKRMDYLNEMWDTEYGAYAERGFDPKSYLMAMEDQGVDKMALFGVPTVGAWGLDPAVADAMVRGFNRWVADFVADTEDRVIPIGQIDLRNVDAAIREVERCVKEYGFKGFFTNTQPPIPGITLDKPYYDPLWSTFEELDVPLCLHNVAGAGHGQIGQDRFGDWAAPRVAFTFPVEMQVAFFQVLLGGMCERHPNLRVVGLESGAGWLPYILWYYDELYERYHDCDLPPMKLKPSEYFKRQCFLSAELEEPTLKYVVDYIGADNIVTACDFPHPEGPYPDGVRHFIDRNGIDAEAKRKILCDNGQRLYGVT